MYGQKRIHRARLAMIAKKGDTIIYVEPNLDLKWVPGDELGLAPTNYKNTEFDYVTIKTYDSASGKIEL